MASKKKSPKKAVVETDAGMLPGTPANRERMAKALASMPPGVASVLARMDPDVFVRFEQVERECLTLDDAAANEARSRLGLIDLCRRYLSSVESTIDELASAIEAAKKKAPKAGTPEVDLPGRLLSRLRACQRMMGSQDDFIVVSKLAPEDPDQPSDHRKP